MIYMCSAVFWTIRASLLFWGSHKDDRSFKTGSVEFTIRGIIISTSVNLAIFSAKYCAQIYFWPKGFVMYRSKIRAVSVEEGGYFTPDLQEAESFELTADRDEQVSFSVAVKPPRN